MSELNEGRQYSIGNVLGGAWAAVFRNFWPMLAVVVLFNVLSFVAAAVIGMLFGTNVATASPAGDASSAFVQAFGWRVVALYLVFAFLAAAELAAITQLTVLALGKREFTVGEVLSHGVRRAVPMFAVGVLFYLGIILTAITIVGPLILGVRWSAAPQACAVEDTGLIQSFSRSADLTRGSRWMILVASIVVTAVLVLALLGIFALFGTGALGIGAAANAGVGGLAIGGVVALFAAYLVVSTLASMYIFSLSGAHYVELKRVRDGADARQLAEIFA
jgi:hypothetical protein